MTAAVLGSRALFPQLEARAYLNHASVAPPCAPVVEAVSACLATYARLGLGAVGAAMETRTALKQDLAGLLGCDAEELALTGSTTRGLIDLSVCLGLRPGERLLGFDGEFPANITPWQQAAAVSGATFERLPQRGLSDGDVLAEVEAALERGPVRLIAVSAVQFSTGRAMPLAELVALAHAHGAEVCVDGIQGIGVMPLDVRELGVDYLCGGGHKWLMGVEGAGFLYAPAARAAELFPRTAGWLSHEDPVGFLTEGPGRMGYDRPIRSGIDFLEGHSMSALGFAALRASVKLLRELGVPRIQAHVRAYNDALEAGLVARGFTSLRAPGSPSGTLSVLPPAGDDPLAWGTHLQAHGIAMSVPDGILRFSPHWPNPLDEVELVLAAVDAWG